MKTRNAFLPLVLILLGCPTPASEAPSTEGSAGPPATSPTTQLVLLGTGTPNAEPDRAGSSLAVVVNGTPYLVDAGSGVIRRANEAADRGIEGLAMDRLTTLFLTHLHSDHTLGLPDLLLTPWVLGREAPLEIHGPPGGALMPGHIQEAYAADILTRLEGSEPANATGYRAVYHEVSPGLVYEDANVRVLAFPVPHGDWSHAFAYRFETPDRVIVVSGDTAPSEVIEEACRGCDILVHEVYSQAGWERRTRVWQEYHAASHTSGPALGRLASAAEPGLLVLTHQLLWGATPEELLAEVRSEFSGSVVYGRDLDVF